MTIRLFAISLLLLLGLSACGGSPSEAGDEVHAGGYGSADARGQKGPHGGRLLTDGGFAVELTIFERGVPPEFRAYAYRNGEPLSPEAVQLTVELSRLGGQTDRFGFAPQGDFLRGSATVAEPHSFDVKVQATADGAQHARESAERGLGVKPGRFHAEYLVEETRDLARGIDVEEWMDQVDRLRERSDRIEARLARLERQRTAEPRSE